MLFRSALRFRSNSAAIDGGAIAFIGDGGDADELTALVGAARFRGNRDLSAPVTPNVVEIDCPSP